jgi:hypothetical protein
MSETRIPTSSSGVLRLQAYRRRLIESERTRTEILLPNSVRDAIQGIAKAEGAGYLDTVSALAQMGLETYQGLATTALASSAGSASPLRAAFVGSSELGAAANFGCLSAQSASITDAQPAQSLGSPLSRFLKSRKDLSDAQ